MEYGYRYGEENLFWSWIWRGWLRIKEKYWWLVFYESVPAGAKKNFNGEFNIKKCHLSNTKSMVRPFGHRTDSRTIVSLTMKIMIDDYDDDDYDDGGGDGCCGGDHDHHDYQPVTSIHACSFYPWQSPPVWPKHPPGGKNVNKLQDAQTDKLKRWRWQSAMELRWFFLFLEHFLSIEHRKFCKTASRYHR